MASANKLRGGVSPYDYMNVVLGLVFLKYLSDRFEVRRDKLIADGEGFEAWWLNQKKYLSDRLGNTDRLFCTEDGTDISPGLFRVWLQKTLAKVDLPKVTLHSLRHTNITLQLVAGVDMKTVSARAGHSKASTTSDFYSHFIKTPTSTQVKY